MNKKEFQYKKYKKYNTRNTNQEIQYNKLKKYNTRNTTHTIQQMKQIQQIQYSKNNKIIITSMDWRKEQCLS